jgi:hypothetical protein
MVTRNQSLLFSSRLPITSTPRATFLATVRCLCATTFTSNIAFALVFSDRHTNARRINSIAEARLLLSAYLPKTYPLNPSKVQDIEQASLNRPRCPQPEEPPREISSGSRRLLEHSPSLQEEDCRDLVIWTRWSGAFDIGPCG